MFFFNLLLPFSASSLGEQRKREKMFHFDLACLGSILNGDGLFAELNDCLVDADIDGLWHGGSQGVDVEKLALNIRLDFNLEVVKDLVDLTRSFWGQHVGLSQWVDLQYFSLKSWSYRKSTSLTSVK